MEMNPVVAEALPKLKSGPKQRQQPKPPGRTHKALGSRTLAQFPKALSPELKAQQFTSPTKHYRLVWVLGGNFWLCGEDETLYRKVHGPGGVVEAGKALAEKLKTAFKE
jgi:hypothetical protein